jgi:hypothetical protein
MKPGKSPDDAKGKAISLKAKCEIPMHLEMADRPVVALKRL